MSNPVLADDSEDSMLKAKQKIAAMFSQKGVNGAKARKTREKKIRATVDGRSLSATGRVAQFNVRVREDVKAMIVSTAAERGCTIAELVEEIFIQALGEPPAS